MWVDLEGTSSTRPTPTPPTCPTHPTPPTPPIPPTSTATASTTTSPPPHPPPPTPPPTPATAPTTHPRAPPIPPPSNPTIESIYIGTRAGPPPTRTASTGRVPTSAGGGAVSGTVRREPIDSGRGEGGWRLQGRGSCTATGSARAASSSSATAPARAPRATAGARRPATITARSWTGIPFGRPALLGDGTGQVVPARVQEAGPEDPPLHALLQSPRRQVAFLSGHAPLKMARGSRFECKARCRLRSPLVFCRKRCYKNEYLLSDKLVQYDIKISHIVQVRTPLAHSFVPSFFLPPVFPAQHEGRPTGERQGLRGPRRQGAGAADRERRPLRRLPGGRRPVGDLLRARPAPRPRRPRRLPKPQGRPSPPVRRAHRAILSSVIPLRNKAPCGRAESQEICMTEPEEHLAGMAETGMYGQ